MAPGRSTAVKILATVCAALVAVGLAAAPAPAAAAPPWMDTTLSPDQRADLLAAAMTLDQKLLLFAPNPAPGIPELGIPGRREQDGTSGPHGLGVPTVGFPAEIALASSWNRDLARAFGDVAADETWNLGRTGWAAPGLDLTRNPFHGRQWASAGEDPLLGGLIPASVVQGVNENRGVYALPKHWLLNTQETQRATLNGVVDERALREMYVRQWEPMIAAGPGAIMCAFPRVNGEYACENEHLLTDILKGDLGFPGWVSSDFNACHTFEAFLAGTDVCGPAFPTTAEFREAVLNGTIPAARFDDMVHRILRTYFARGVIDNPPPGSTQVDTPAPGPLPADVIARGREVAYRVAVDGSVLLRNRAQALPLNQNATDSIAVIGEGADRFIAPFGADTMSSPTDVVPILDGIRSRAGTGVGVTYTEGSDPVRPADNLPGDQPVPSGVLRPATGAGAGLTAQWFPNPDFGGDPLVTRVEDQVSWGNGLSAVLATFGYEASPAPDLPPPFIGIPSPSIRWTGTLAPVQSGSYRLSLTVLGRATLWVDGRQVLTVDTDRLTTESAELDLTAGEQYDVRIDYVADAPNQCCPGQTNIGPTIRFGWAPPNAQASPQIREAVRAARASDLAVVVANDYLGESLDRGHFRLPQNQDLLIQAVARANPNTVVVLTTGAPVEMPWLNRVAAVMESWYPGQEQGRAVAALLFGDENFAGRLPLTWPRSQDQVTEGLGIENPVYDVNNPGVTVPHDEGIFFGYRGFDQRGLSPLFPFGYGLSYARFQYRDIRITDPRRDPDRAGQVRVRVRNTGTVTATEVVQVYHGRLPADVATPPKQLLGWARVTLAPGEARWVDIPIRLNTGEHQLAYWDQGAWYTPPGRVAIYAGSSSRDVRLTGNVTVR
jgi:beta-glucosidase